MDKKTVFHILGIPETKDAMLIKNAYREKLIKVNPEDDPEGFKRLRSAYEEAVRLIDVQEEETQVPTTPVEMWIKQVEQVYNRLSTRIDRQCWQALFLEEICQDFDTEDEAREALLVFLMDHYRLPVAIWQLIEEKFELIAKEEELYEKFPSGFIEFLLYQLKSKGWMDYTLFEGEDDGDYDSFLDQCFSLKRKNDEYAYEGIEENLEKLEQMTIWHPYLDVEKLRYYLAQKAIKEAEVLAKKLRQTHGEELYVLYYLSTVSWEIGDFEKAYEDCQTILKEIPEHFGARQRSSDYYLKKGEYEKAKEGYLELLEIDGSDESLHTSLEESNRGLIAEYEKQLIQEPSNKKLKLDLGWCFFQNRRFEECIKLLETMEVDESIYFDYHNLIGRVYLSMEDYEKALTYLRVWLEELEKIQEDRSQEARRKLRRLPFAYYALSNCYFQLGRHKEEKESDLSQSIHYLDQAIEVEKNMGEKTEYFSKKAQILLEIGKNEACIDTCDLIIAAYKDYFPAYVYRQEAYFNLRRGQEVIDDFYRAIEIFAGYAKPYLLAAKVFYIFDQYEEAMGVIKRGKDAEVVSLELEFQELKIRRMQVESREEEQHGIIEGLIQLFEKGKEDPGDLEDLSAVLHEQALCYITMNCNEEALVIINQKLEMKRTEGSIKLKGDVLYNLRKYEEALAVYQTVLEHCPDYETAMCDVADCYMQLGQEELAVHYYGDALKINPEHHFANNKLMEIYQERYKETYQQEDYQKAVAYANRQIEIRPICYYYNELGLLYLDGYQLDEALEAFGAASQEDETDMYAYNNTGFVHKIMGSYEKAEQSYQLAIENRVPGSLKPYWNMAMYYKITKQYQKAIETYIFIGQEAPSMEEAASKLAEVYQRQGQWQLAIEAYGKAIELTEENYMDYLLEIGKTHAYAGNHKIAKKLFKKVIKRYPKKSEPLSVYAEYNQCMVGDFKKATKYYQKACLVAKAHDYDRYEDTLEDLLDLLKVLGKERRTPKYLERLMDYTEKEYGSVENWLRNPAYRKIRLYRIALWYYNTGAYEVAKDYLKQMEETRNCRQCQYGECFEYYRLKGLMLEVEKDYKGALEKYCIALQVCPDSMSNISKVKEMERKVGEPK